MELAAVIGLTVIAAAVITAACIAVVVGMELWFVIDRTRNRNR